MEEKEYILEHNHPGSSMSLGMREPTENCQGCFARTKALSYIEMGLSYAFPFLTDKQREQAAWQAVGQIEGSLIFKQMVDKRRAKENK